MSMGPLATSCAGENTIPRSGFWGLMRATGPCRVTDQRELTRLRITPAFLESRRRSTGDGFAIFAAHGQLLELHHSTQPRTHTAALRCTPLSQLPNRCLRARFSSSGRQQKGPMGGNAGCPLHDSRKPLVPISIGGRRNSLALAAQGSKGKVA
jgi:hypothetical protein